MILSIDIGSVAVSAVLVDYTGIVHASFYRYHHGKVSRILSELCSEFNLEDVSSVVSPSETEWLQPAVLKYNSDKSLIAGVKHYYSNTRAILVVGAGRFQLMHFNVTGEFSHSVTSTSCAAGTGSFLDQQAARLDMTSTSELSSLAEENCDVLPDIASRCSVFAKTDLVHAQQAGYSLPAICDSLCRGLARNIADTLFDDLEVPPEIVFAGGVSLNSSVRRHLTTITGARFDVHKYSSFFPAIGAALLFAAENKSSPSNSVITPSAIIAKPEVSRHYLFDPLVPGKREYPDFNAGVAKYFMPLRVKHHGRVEIEIFENSPKGENLDCYIGLDIGSTSTKSIVLNRSGSAVAGFYTYTHGQPLPASRAIFEAIQDWAVASGINLSVLASATTGSGRKFIGALVGADMAVDEITTHARAASVLNPETDTIIEIGGQDAKFSCLKNGIVTFSRMNSVCAAGTGSFIEEQALKLGVKLDDYSSLAENSRSPLASDRCTVFMERDINYYLNTGYETGEILAAVLHSVRDNYLKKVAVESSIGSNICFQGATAKNRALVAAFELKLGKQIYVSRYCHLTGALGSALIARDEFTGISSFRGFELIDREINLKTENCGLCNNNCRITVAEIKGEKVAWGFLCGRDYATERFVEKNISGFNLLKERKRIVGITREGGSNGIKKTITIGLPAGLHIFEELDFWKLFLSELGFNTLSSENLTDPLAEGKRMAGAEFCAPMHALHGHIKWLADRVDYIFIPALLQERDEKETGKNLYCYYTQFSPSVVSIINSNIKSKCIVPLLNYERGMDRILETLYKSLKAIDQRISPLAVKNAYQAASSGSVETREKLRQLFTSKLDENDEISVVLLGRPYLVLSKSLNSGIPDIFGSMGIRIFYQDMLPLEKVDPGPLDELLKSMPWHFASTVLKAAEYIARSDRLFPVFITAFKCAPDSFVIEYFQQLLDSYGKPYLILQTDEHDSSVGYETRIEAAVRSFRNHQATGKDKDKGRLAVTIKTPVRKLSRDKIILFPNWDQIAGRFLVANLKRYGYDSRLLDHTELGIRKAMATNTGQCLPLNIIAQDYIDYIEQHNLDPASTILWMTETRLSCNIRMYPQYISTILQKQANGLGRASVYTGELSHTEISANLTIYAYFAYMLSGLLRRTGCRLRPYELVKGRTDQVLDDSIKLLEEAFLGRRRIELAIRDIIDGFNKIETMPGRRPLVAIFGDFFVRDNDIMNQDLFHTIEKFGGEALNTPYSEYYKLISENVLRRRSLDKPGYEIMGYRALLVLLNHLERKYLRYFEPFTGKQKQVKPLELEKNLSRFNIDLFHSGESYDNILKIFHIIESYPGISLFVQTNPSFCCPSLITEAMKNEIRRQTGIPIVTITYDGTTERKNDILAAYL